MDPKEFMAYYKKEIEAELQRFFEDKKAKLQHWTSREICDVIQEYTLRGGKRIRAILMVVGYKMYGGTDERAIIRAASSLELIQSYFLIHDDIMDESELRRGKKTVHLIYEDKHLKNGFGGNPRRFGENMAIIAGDLANVYAYEIFVSSPFPEPLKLRALQKLNEIIEYTGYGQIIDVYSSELNDFSEDDLLLLHTYKTAKYTIEGPLKLGAILAGASGEGLEKYAVPVGVAFQLQDDILGLFGDEKKLGKPVTSDLAEGKKTLLILKALEKVTEEEKRTILEALGNPAVTMEQLNAVRDIVMKTGALEYTKALAEKLVKDGVAALKELEVRDESMKEILFWLADYLINRTY